MDVFVCGMAGIREAASRQGTWQPLPADSGAGLLHRAGWMSGSQDWGEACCLLTESRGWHSPAQHSWGGSKTPAPFTPYPRSLESDPGFLCHPKQERKQACCKS